jgi:hypothetical protein
MSDGALAVVRLGSWLETDSRYGWEERETDGPSVKGENHVDERADPERCTSFRSQHLSPSATGNVAASAGARFAGATTR